MFASFGCNSEKGGFASAILTIMNKNERENLRPSRCAVCRCEERFAFHVPDDIWWSVVPVDYRKKVLCLSCFDQLAREKDIKYANTIENLYFAGDQAKLKFETVSARDG
jgi:hypothetical protein